MKTKFLLSIILLIFLQACKNKEGNEQNTGESELTEVEEQEFIDDSLNYQDDLYHSSDIISKSAPNLKLVENQWDRKTILCTQKEKFIILRKINDSRFIAISREEKENYKDIFRFYDCDTSGIVFHKSILPNADYSMDNRFNIQIIEDSVYYFTSKESNKVLSYSLIDNSHTNGSKGKLNWQLINDWKNESKYLSNDMNSKILLQDVQLIFSKENQDNDTLINQKYDGTWSFRQGTWSDDDSKFYFDNSGAVACIWEINLRENTLDKIVTDHWAKAPIYINNGGNDAVVYCNKNCVYITSKKEN